MAATPTYQKPPPLSLEQSRIVASTHYHALKSWLSKTDGLAPNSNRNNAREKLTRLTRQQFQELSTDVYDELMRRVDDQAGRAGNEPYLAVRNEFHPKRNQARQKLATLPLQRFRDLASDVYFELERRYPEFGEESAPISPTYSNTGPVPGLASRSRDGSISHIPANSASLLRRTPTPNSTASPNPTANDTVIPNKSTLIMEEPNSNSNYGPTRGSAGKSSDDLPNSHESNDRLGYGGLTKSHSISQGGGNSGETVSQDGSRGMNGRASETSSLGTRFMANYSGSAGASDTGGRRSWDNEEFQKMKSDYEYKITVMTKRMTELERENDSSRDALKGQSIEAARARDLESQVRNHRDRYDSQSATLQKLQTDHEVLQSTHSRSLSSNESTSRLRQDVEHHQSKRMEAEELVNEMRGEVSSLVDELRSVNERYEELLEASEREGGERREMEEQIISWRKRFEGAKTELRNIKATSQLFVGSSIKFDGDHMPASTDGTIADVHVSGFQISVDELLSAARSKDPSAVLPAMRAVVAAVTRVDQDIQAVDARRIASLSNSEQESLESLKVKTNATLSNLMTATKNHATSFGVMPVSLVDAAASHLSSAIVDIIRILRIRRTSGSSSAQQTPAVPNLRTNGSSSTALSRSIPSSNGRQAEERAYASPPESERHSERGREREEERYRPPSPSYTSSNYTPQQEVDSRDNRYDETSPRGTIHPEDDRREDRYGQNQYSSHTRAGSVLTYGSPNPTETEWPELKSYLENQTEAIVHSIQSLLSAIRGGAQGGQLNENLTQIITIVSSIVAITKDALPPSSKQEGDLILADLADNCSKLSEMQVQSSRDQNQVFNKQTKQSMASASFGVAKSLKSLNALLAEEGN